MRRTLMNTVLVVAAASMVKAEFSIDPTSYTDHFGDSLRVVDDCLSHIRSGYWVCYENVEFREDYDRIAIEHSQAFHGRLGILNFMLDSLWGIWFASCTTGATANCSVFTVDTFRIHGTYEGNHSVVVEFRRLGWDPYMGDFRDFTLFPLGTPIVAHGPAATGIISRKSTPCPRLMTFLFPREAGAAQQAGHGNAFTVYDLRGRIEKVIAPFHQDPAGKASPPSRRGAGQVLVIAPIR